MLSVVPTVSDTVSSSYMIHPKKVIISRTDSIGDVVLTLPMAGMLKQLHPEVQVVFLGRTYTQPVVAQSQFVDDFLNMDELEEDPAALEKALTDSGADTIIHVFPNKMIARAANRSGIANRVGTIRKVMHLGLVNHKLNFTRKKSDLHEAQLNLKMLEPFGLKTIPELSE